MITIPWLTPYQQQVAIVVLIILACVLTLIAVAGGGVWYLVYKKGIGPMALVWLLPVLVPLALFFPLIWLLGASFQQFEESHDPANRPRSPEPAVVATRAGAQQPHTAPVVAAVAATAEGDRSESPRLADWMPAPSA